MGLIVLAEHEIAQRAVIAHNGQRIELVVPNDVVRFGEGCALLRGDKFFQRRHKRLYKRGLFHACHTVIAAGHDADQLAVRRAVVRYGNGGVTGLFFERKHIRQRRIGRDVGIRRHKARLIRLCARHHRGFIRHRL